MRKNADLQSFLQNAQTGNINTLESIYLGIQMAMAHGEKVGFGKGVIAGRVIGYNECFDNMKPVISEGLRHGSPKCGETLRQYKKI